jgi:hypothetical protein
VLSACTLFLSLQAYVTTPFWLSSGCTHVCLLPLQELCAALKGSSSLRSLELPRNCIGDVGAGALADLVAASPQLATLLLGYNHIGDQGAVALAKVRGGRTGGHKQQSIWWWQLQVAQPSACSQLAVPCWVLHLAHATRCMVVADDGPAVT